MTEAMWRPGAVVALVSRQSPEEIRAGAARWVPEGWEVDVRATAWGSALLGGPAVLTEGSLAIVGTAVGDPWGVPDRPIRPEVLLSRTRMYGHHAMELAAGPFAIVDIGDGTLSAALNGIVPILIARGRHVVVGNHREMVMGLAAAAGADPVPAGAVASISGHVASVARMTTAEALPLVDLRALEREIEGHVRRAGHPGRARVAGLPRHCAPLRVRDVHRCLIAMPRLGTLARDGDPLRQLDRLRESVGRLWWWAALRNMPVFAPAFERPAIDTMMLGLGALA